MGSIISIFILWCLYSIMEGYREAQYYDSLWKGYSKIYIEPVNLHTAYTLQRILVLGIICFTDFNWWLISLPLVFSFLHDGSYYFTRNKLNRSIYKKGWFAQSTTSTAWSTKFLTPVIRTIMFITGVGILIIYLL